MDEQGESLDRGWSARQLQGTSAEAGLLPPTGFASSLASFNLRPAVGSTNTSHTAGQTDATPLEGYPLFSRRSSSSSANFSFSASALSSSLHRHQYLQQSSGKPASESGSDNVPSVESFSAGRSSRLGSDSPMLIGSPPIEQYATMPPHPPSAGRRSRTASESLGSSSALPPPPSPMAVARALQGQPRTPPPFLQRRLYNEMQDDAAGISAREAIETDPLGMALAEEASGGVSASSDDARSGVTRRAVSRKPNLLPKSKSHLRVLSQLQSEAAPDLAEVTSEAALHRLSVASSMPPTRSTSASAFGIVSGGAGGLSSSASANGLSSMDTRGGAAGGSSGAGARSAPSLGNRFPEQVVDEDDMLPRSPESSEDDGPAGGGGPDDAIDMCSDFGGMVTDTEDDEERKAAIWTGIRGSGSGAGMVSVASSSNGRSPGSRSDQASAVPQTWQTQSSSRPGKRKITEDRFEPYATAFKRRAVSPAALSPGNLVSPLLTHTTATSLSTPPPLPTFPPSLLSNGSGSFPLPISIPSPSAALSSSSSSSYNNLSTLTGPGLHHQQGGPVPSFLSRSRAGSPAPSSLSSSAGRASGRAGLIMSSRVDREREAEERNIKMGDAGDGLRNMSLG